MRKIESGFIGSPDARSRYPMTLNHAICPLRATSITAPGSTPDSICRAVTVSMFASRSDDSPRDSGDVAIGSDKGSTLGAVAQLATAMHTSSKDMRVIDI